jgi:TPR repeat protein
MAEPEADVPPLPSYDAVMRAESREFTNSPSSFDDHRRQSQGQIPNQPGHSRTTSLEQAPFAPVDYGQPYYQAPHEQQRNSHPNPYLTHNQAQNQHRLSGGSYRRDSSDPNDPNGLDFSALSFTQMDPHGRGQAPPSPVMRHNTTYHPQQNRNQPQRRVTSGYAGGAVDGSASVYSLDSGMGAYGGGGGGGYGQGNIPPLPYNGGPPPPNTQSFASNPYYSAASDLLGPPPGQNGPMYASSSSLALPMRQDSTPSLARTNTTASAMSSMSQVSLTRKPTEVVGATSTRRRGVNAAVDLNKPPYTKQYVDDYRKRMKDDPDPEAQFAFSKYLIEAAKKLGDEISSTDPRLGRKYRDQLLQESLRNVKKLAESKQPYADAQFFLANLYGTGQLGLQVDHEKAYYLYLMASKLNHPAATYRSAVCNEIGAGTKKDPNRAVLFYRKAAALGDTAAMYKLGMILLGGLLHQPRNLRESGVWLRRAAAQADEDNPHALHELALLHERQNNGGVVPYDPNMARELFSQAAQLGYAPAQFRLGACHEFGNLGCVIDPRRSIAWYTKAAQKGDPEAELALSGWYLTGSGTSYIACDIENMADQYRGCLETVRQ